MTIRIKDWKKFQHFRDRKPLWIKLYRDILDDPDWHDLDAKSSKVLVMLWLVASEDPTKEGVLPDLRKLSFRLHMTEAELTKSIQNLSHYLILPDIKMISEGYQVDALEKEKEKEKKETTSLVELTRPRRENPIEHVIAFLNQKAGTAFKPTTNTSKQHIGARLKEGFSLQDFETVIDAKVFEWATDAKMAQYLRPQTLFGTKFESYLMAARAEGGGIAQDTKVYKLPDLEEVKRRKREEAERCSTGPH